MNLYTVSNTIKALIFTLILIFSACNKTGDKKAGEESIKPATIKNAIEAQYTTSDFVKAQNIGIQVEKGVVTLNGNISSLLAKDKAAELAKQVEGVTSVVNNTIVSSDRPDKAIIEDVRQALASNPATEPLELTAEINKGVVTLEGIVHSQAERQIARNVAASVKDVNEIINKIVIDYKKVPSSAEIKEVVKQRFRWDSRLWDGMIDVEVNNQTVKLSGSVASLSQKELAEELAFVEGVQKVNSSALSIKPAFKSEMTRENWNAERTDQQIKESVKKALTYDPLVSAFDISVEVHNGDVVLTGKVDNLKAKNAAERDAKNTVGVNTVANNIQVEKKVIVRNDDISVTDQALQKRAHSVLDRDEIVEVGEINISVKNGVATLTGTVHSKLEKKRATNLLEEVIGLIGIQNNLKVAGS